MPCALTSHVRPIQGQLRNEFTVKRPPTYPQLPPSPAIFSTGADLRLWIPEGTVPRECRSAWRFRCKRAISTHSSEVDARRGVSRQNRGDEKATPVLRAPCGLHAVLSITPAARPGVVHNPSDALWITFRGSRHQAPEQRPEVALGTSLDRVQPVSDLSRPVRAGSSWFGPVQPGTGPFSPGRPDSASASPPTPRTRRRPCRGAPPRARRPPADTSRDSAPAGRPA